MGEFRFARVFRAGMVLQRGCAFTVWGFGAEGEIAVECRGTDNFKTVCRALPDGRFFAEFPAVAGGSAAYTLSAVCGEKRAEVSGVRFGDVYLLLGQSNMSYPLSAVEKRKSRARRAARADIAFLSLTEPPFSDLSEVTRPVSPLQDLARDYSYISADEEKLAGASAIGVMAAVYLSERARVPVGMVDTSMGGLSVEAYLPREYAESDAELKEYLERTGRYVPADAFNSCGERNYTQLSGVYNEKVAPLAGLRFCAMVWYLGESAAYDLETALFFERELRCIVRHYRRLFGEIPFVAVQIANEYYPYGDRCGLMYVNESIDRLAREEPGCFAVPAYAVEPRWMVKDGDMYYHPIHPVNKQPIAAAIAKILYENAVCRRRYAFPRIRSASPDGAGGIVCEIEDAGEGFAERPLYGFSVCGADGKYYTAKAEAVSADRIRLTSAQVAEPTDMTYAFVPDPEDCDAFLKTGEPLLPYRTRREEVHGGYDPLPHWLCLQRETVAECCFGWSVGMQRRVPRWEKGRVYGNFCRISVLPDGGGTLKISARPNNAGYYFFGASPRVCLSGHRSGLADYPFLRVQLGASKEGVTFYGIAVRMASGEIFRFAPRNAGAAADAVPLFAAQFSDYCVGLEQAFREDSALVTLDGAERGQIAEAEFLFRSRSECEVYLRNIELIGSEVRCEYAEGERRAASAAMQLPVSR